MGSILVMLAASARSGGVISTQLSQFRKPPLVRVVADWQ